MTFDLEIGIWIFFCLIGLGTSGLSFRLAKLILGAVQHRYASQEVIDGSKHLWRTELERVVGWTMFLACGVLALFDAPDSQTPIGTTSVGIIIRWLLIGTIVLWSYKTASDFGYSRRLWLQTKARILTTGAAK